MTTQPAEDDYMDVDVDPEDEPWEQQQPSVSPPSLSPAWQVIMDTPVSTYFAPGSIIKPPPVPRH